MKNAIYLFALLFTTTVFGQTKDRRAAIYIEGRVDEISVSPDEKIWLVTALGNTYYTNRIDSNWHYGKPVFKSTEELDSDHPGLDRISFFNKDTAIMTGYISVEKKGHNNNGFYLTQDGGANWKLLDYGGNSCIYTAYTDKQGNAWLGGQSKEIYYSGDFGQHWKTLKLPFKRSDRIYGIYMTDSMHG
ncbi:MAG: WD40/YVTN/BNR-like repeat-containing protein, partial [Saprospiraceae bacterium]